MADKEHREAEKLFLRVTKKGTSAANIVTASRPNSSKDYDGKKVSKTFRSDLAGDIARAKRVITKHFKSSAA